MKGVKLKDREWEMRVWSERQWSNHESHTQENLDLILKVITCSKKEGITVWFKSLIRFLRLLSVFEIQPNVSVFLHSQASLDINVAIVSQKVEQLQSQHCDVECVRNVDYSWACALFQVQPRLPWTGPICNAKAWQENPFSHFRADFISMLGPTLQI